MSDDHKFSLLSFTCTELSVMHHVEPSNFYLIFFLLSKQATRLQG